MQDFGSLCSFKRKSDLNRRIASIDEGIKPFNCNICGNTFARKGLKTQHEKIENEKKIYNILSTFGI